MRRTRAKRLRRSAPRREIRAEEFGTTERDDWSNGTEGDDFDGIRETPSGASNSGNEGDETDEQDRRGSSESLQDHLRAQIAGMRLGDEDRAALEVLIESLDGDGYLADPTATWPTRCRRSPSAWLTCWA